MHYFVDLVSIWYAKEIKFPYRKVYTKDMTF